jgi:hypothetical protein
MKIISQSTSTFFNFIFDSREPTGLQTFGFEIEQFRMPYYTVTQIEIEANVSFDALAVNEKAISQYTYEDKTFDAALQASDNCPLFSRSVSTTLEYDKIVNPFSSINFHDLLVSLISGKIILP